MIRVLEVKLRRELVEVVGRKKDSFERI